MECYEDGLIDDFGIVTPKGHEQILEYTSKIQPAFSYTKSSLPYEMLKE
jgi:hypothetical protein